MSLTNIAANEPIFEPVALADPAFITWVTGVALRLRNLAPGSPEYRMRRALFSTGTPNPDWAQAFIFVMTLAQVNRREAPSRA